MFKKVSGSNPIQKISDLFQSKKEKTSDATLMSVLAKVSAAYTKLKAENAEMQKTIKILELENLTLKEILSSKNKKDEEATKKVKPETEEPKSKKEFRKEK